MNEEQRKAIEDAMQQLEDNTGLLKNPNGGHKDKFNNTSLWIDAMVLEMLLILMLVGLLRTFILRNVLIVMKLIGENSVVIVSIIQSLTQKITLNPAVFIITVC